MLDKRGERIIVARASWLDDMMPMAERLSVLALDAAREALQPMTHSRVRSRIRLHLALSREGLGDQVRARQVADSLVSSLDGAPVDDEVAIVMDGHAGGFLAMKEAVEELRSGRSAACLVGGVDSYMTADRLEAIDFAGNLHSSHNTWGFTPGEGAGFCLMATGATVAELGLTPVAELQAVATAQEGQLLGTRTVCIGEGLTAAFRAVLGTGDRVHHTFCDLNGEIYRADEFGFALCRTSEHFVDATQFTAAAECWGDVGAASAQLALGLAVASWERGYAKGHTLLTWASSARGPLRGAAKIKQAVNPRQ
ncbi:beta-ketoacyl synthase N-terminal-like domain-containing protein [Cystobacter ferrugineus]|nr:beta-ketoacyl synthase N-terminal-like domain-containing protein [Cystobacter ferrugineus]